MAQTKDKQETEEENGETVDLNNQGTTVSNEKMSFSSVILYISIISLLAFGIWYKVIQKGGEKGGKEFKY